tara:strand:- start:1190 stop:2017 length:828 start_codon:yes stop_codon:yes gene_type:complete
LGSKDLSKYLGKQRISPVTLMLTPDEINYIIDQCDKIPKCMSSHYLPIPTGLEALRQRFNNVKMITFLRDPIARVISHYFAFRKKRLLEVELPKHVKYDYRYDMNNFFRNDKYVSSKYGIHNSTENHQTYFIDNSINIRKAISRLRNDFWFVGIVERFDEGLLILKDQFNKLGKNFDIMYMRQQIAPRTEEEINQLVTSEIRDKIKDTNKLDLQLYQEAKQIFEERKKSYSGDFESDLREYRKRLRKWQLYQNQVSYKGKKIIEWVRNKFTIGHR